MKIGDKLICKQNFGFFNSIGKIYVVTTLHERSCLVKLTNENQFGRFQFSRSLYDYFYIWDYFYTEQELRKLKLDKLDATI